MFTAHVHGAAWVSGRPETRGRAITPLVGSVAGHISRVVRCSKYRPTCDSEKQIEIAKGDGNHHIGRVAQGVRLADRHSLTQQFDKPDDRGERKPDLRRTGRQRLQWSFRLHLLSSAVRVQPAWRSRAVRPALGQRAQRRQLARMRAPLGCDAGTADVFTEISRATDKQLWLVEAPSLRVSIRVDAWCSRIRGAIRTSKFSLWVMG
jgi:hypothetical protein